MKTLLFSIPLFSRTGISPSESHVCAIIVPIPGNKLDAVFTMRSRQYRAIEVGKDAVVTLQPTGFGLRGSFHRSHVLQRSGGDVLITWRDSLPASHEWQSHSQEPCRTS